MKGLIYLIGVISVALPALAGEDVVLTNGFRLHADRHETEGAVVRIYDAGGVRQLPVASVAGYEVEEPPAVAMVAVVPMPIVQTPEPTTPHEMAAHAARKYSLPEGFVKSVMRAESGFNPAALSPKGATGLMQLMPDTAKHLGVNERDPRQNAEGGAQYLRELLARYESQPDQVLLALAAYNAGPGAVEKYHGVPPYRETREYILRVLKNWDLSEDR